MAAAARSPPRRSAPSPLGGRSALPLPGPARASCERQPLERARSAPARRYTGNRRARRADSRPPAPPPGRDPGLRCCNSPACNRARCARIGPAPTAAGRTTRPAPRASPRPPSRRRASACATTVAIVRPGFGQIVRHVGDQVRALRRRHDEQIGEAVDVDAVLRPHPVGPRLATASPRRARPRRTRPAPTDWCRRESPRRR